MSNLLAKKGKFAFLSIFVFASVVSLNSANAQSLSCKTPSEKAACEKALEEVLKEQKQAEQDLADARNQSASLSKDISVLTAKIKAAELNIKAKNLLIQTLANDISNKQEHIEDLEEHIKKGKETLAVILRKTNELDQYSLPEVILSQSTLSGFFEDVDTFESVQNSLKSTFNQLRSDQVETATEKDALDKRRNAEVDARYEIQQQRKSIETDQKEKQRLLALSKGSENAYVKVVADRAARVASIRAALFPLAGGQKIPFGQALQYAQEVSAKTGVRPAFLLAILTNESALGANVGNCYLVDLNTGAGVFASTGKPSSSVMKPSRDVQPFLTITRALGLDYTNTVVSCQQPSVGGWGGGMGAAQFIPSTWMLMKDNVSKVLGIDGMPNPWNHVHAFMASALFLRDLGAANGGYTSERNAACRYYSGSPCTKSKAIASYGDKAIIKATEIQRDINDLSGR